RKAPPQWGWAEGQGRDLQIDCRAQVIEFILQIFLEDVTMATIGAFINLPEPENDKETRLRQKILETVLIGHQLKYVYGKAEYDQYPDKANVLASTDPIPDIFLATCWPSMDALRDNTTKAIMFTGVTDAGGATANYAPRITGLKGFAATNLCRNWL